MTCVTDIQTVLGCWAGAILARDETGQLVSTVVQDTPTDAEGMRRLLTRATIAPELFQWQPSTLDVADEDIRTVTKQTYGW
jgi:hypothetical protein